MPRKYVMANKEDGRSDIVSEVDLNDLPVYSSFLRGTDLWLNCETPADLSGTEDPVLGKPITHEPPDGGAVFRMLVLPPVSASTREDYLAVHERLGSVHVPTASDLDNAKDASMHKTDTLNYFCIAYGEIWALSEGRDVLLRAGDVIIQKGCMHGWRNDGPGDACIVCVLIDSHPATP